MYIYVCAYVYTYMHTYIPNRILLSHKEWNFSTCHNMFWVGRHYVGEISQIKINTVWYHLYVESEKHNKVLNITKRCKLTDIQKKGVVTSEEREGEEGNTGVKDKRYKELGIK